MRYYKYDYLSYDCAPRHRKESGSQESCRFEKFRGDRFPGTKSGEGGGGYTRSRFCTFPLRPGREKLRGPPDSPGGGVGRLRSGSAVYVGLPLMSLRYCMQCLLTCFCFSFVHG